MSRMLPEAMPGFDPGPEPLPAPGEGNTNAIRLVHRLLRGRYIVTVLLAGIGAAGGAVGGYLATSPKYETYGIVSIEPVLPTILDDRGLPLPMFSSFLNKQAAMMRDLRVLDSAMESDAWRQAGFGRDPAAQAELRRSLTIDTPRDSQLIIVRCVAKDRNYTSVAVREVINAYEKIYAATIDDPNVRIKQMEDLLRTRNQEIEKTDTSIQMAAAAAPIVTDDLTLYHAAILEDVTRLEGKLRDLRTRLAEAGVDPDAVDPVATAASGATPAVRATAEPPSPSAIADVDEEMARLMGEQRILLSQLEALKAGGFLENHQSVREVNNKLAGNERAIQLRRDAWWEAHKSVPIGAAASGTETVEQLITLYVDLKRHRDRIGDELLEVLRHKAKLDALREQRAQQVAERDSYLRRLNNLVAEAQARPLKGGGRVDIISRGSTPGSPNVDKRKQLAAMGFVAGGGAPVALMLLLGLLDRRFRYSDQTEDLGPAPTMLGVLPVLPHQLDDAEQRAIAAHCVHQVRLLLQIGGQATGRKVYAITSPTAGDGKTSLALSLGLSFSAAGARTLLIDFDMIGTGLTSSLRLLNGHAAVSDALERGTLDPADLPMASDKLWVLPSRADDDRLVSRLSTGMVNRLLDAARAAFDVVLIDTGPVLGSLEASLVSAAADGVIVVVGRGQRRDHIQQAFARVAAVGGRLIGMVFNRATPGDFKRSVSSTSMRSVPRALALPAGARSPESDRLGEAGPVVRTVALELDTESQSERAKSS